jgi:3-phenylpropionate/cinnamic acid dioxygenase small subunit
MPDSRAQSISEFLAREAAYVDDQRWDEWLSLFAEDAEYWVPSWDNDTEYTQDPNADLSLIYYSGRFGLEDRVFRLRSGLSSASSPMPRTCHMVTNILPTFRTNGSCAVRASWQAHVYQFKATTTFYGSYHYELLPNGESWLIHKKKILLLNDLIPTVLDIYSI